MSAWYRAARELTVLKTPWRSIRAQCMNIRMELYFRSINAPFANSTSPSTTSWKLISRSTRGRCLSSESNRVRCLPCMCLPDMMYVPARNVVRSYVSESRIFFVLQFSHSESRCLTEGCGKEYRIQSRLKAHEKSHAGYTCEVCENLRFASESKYLIPEPFYSRKDSSSSRVTYFPSSRAT